MTACRRWPGPRLPGRGYRLYRGPVEAVLLDLEFPDVDRAANLWWPADRAWVVASEIDLGWTYVAGSAELVDALVRDARLEAQEVAPEGPLTRVEDWVRARVDQALAQLLNGRGDDRGIYGPGGGAVQEAGSPAGRSPIDP